MLVKKFENPCYKGNTEILLYASKHNGISENAEKTMYMFMMGQKNVWQNQNTKTVNKSFENVQISHIWEWH
jgi:hypothetical protein